MKTKYPGVYIREYKNRLCIQLDFYYKGRRHKPTLRLAPDQKNLKFANRKLRRIESDIEKDSFNPKEHFENRKVLNFIEYKGTPSIGELVNKWRTRNEGKKSTEPRYKDHLRHVSEKFDHIECTELMVPDLQQAIDSIKVSRVTKKNIFRALSGAMKIAIKEGYITLNPFQHIEYTGKRPIKKDPFTYHEMKKIIRTANSYWSKVYTIAFFTGLSTNEQWALKWEDINFEEKTITINKTWDSGTKTLSDTKNEQRERKIEMIRVVYDAFLSLKHTNKNKSPFVFSDKNGKPFSKHVMNRYWGNTLKSAGVKHKGFYSTRHTNISLLLTINVNLEFIKERVGHSSLQMINDNYGKLIEMSAEDVREAQGYWLAKLPDGSVHEQIRIALGK